jgi:hypothetical protein
VIAWLAPTAPVIDLTHRIAPHDIEAGARTLWRTAPWLVPGIVLAVVDPGVGTARRAVAIEVEPAGAALVGPDNGLLLPAALRLGPVTQVVELAAGADPEPGPVGSVGSVGSVGATFAGRDVFAPAAARLAAGEAVSALGPALDPATLQGRPIDATPERDSDDGSLRAEVLWVDRFGNIQLGLSTADLPAGSGPLRLRLPDRILPVRVAPAYADLGPGEVGLVNDSYGLLSLCVDRGSAATRTGLVPGATVGLSRQGRPGQQQEPGEAAGG